MYYNTVKLILKKTFTQRVDTTQTQPNTRISFFSIYSLDCPPFDKKILALRSSKSVSDVVRCYGRVKSQGTRAR